MKKLFFSLIFFMFVASFANAQNGSESKFFLVTFDEWGRANLKCKGWGLCNADWFHCKPDPCFKTTGGKKHSSQLQYNETTKKFFIDIVLDEEAKENFAKENLNTLPVDSDIVLKTKALLGTDLVISKGEYLYEKTTNSYRIVFN